MTKPSIMIDFITLDVFTDRRFAGNPLAIVTDGRQLDDQMMMKIAAEFNLSETVFVLPPDNPAHRARIRIFTPRRELPFAGHPNVGAAWALASIDAARGEAPDHYRFEEIAGIVAVEVQRDRAGALVATRVRAPQPLRVGESMAIQDVANACGLVPDAIRTDRHPPLIASCGTPFVLVELGHRAALTAACPNFSAFLAALPVSKAHGIYLYHVAADPDGNPPPHHQQVHARMFAPALGINEDPATGAAAAALVAMIAHGQGEGLTHAELSIWQGVDMGRPSLIHASATHSDTGEIFAEIAGECVPVMSGTLRLD